MYEDSPSAVWVRFGALAVLALLLCVGLIWFGGYGGGVLLAWAVAAVIGASLILLRRR
jgi:hypothetical protein